MNESIQSRLTDNLVQSGPVQITWYYTLCNASGLVACRLLGAIRCLGQTLHQSNI